MEKDDKIERSIAMISKDPYQKLASFISTFGEFFILIINVLWAILEAIYHLVIPRSKKSVEGEVVLITGAGQGIGRELALVYASEGATVVCVDIQERLNQETVQIISNFGYNKAYAYTCDVADYKKVTELCEQVQNEVGNVTILINNAGIVRAKPFCNMSKLEIENTVNANLMSQFWTVKAILPTMLANNYGHIVSMSSVASLCALPFAIPYTATKYAVRGFMDGLRHELFLTKNCQIKTTTILPYFTDTQMAKVIDVKHIFISLLKKQDVAKIIINAQRKEIGELSIPGYTNLLFGLTSLLPTKAEELILTYLFHCCVETTPF